MNSRSDPLPEKDMVRAGNGFGWWPPISRRHPARRLGGPRSGCTAASERRPALRARHGFQKPDFVWAQLTGSLRGSRAYGMRAGMTASPSVTPENKRSAPAIWFSAGHEMPVAARCLKCANVLHLQFAGICRGTARNSGRTSKPR